MAGRSVEVAVVPATTAHAYELAPRMRAAEVLEVQASGRHTPIGALLAALTVSTVARTALFDDQVACMWGVVPMRRSALGGRIGAVWLLTSYEVERYAKTFWRRCRPELARLFEDFDLLMNAIDSRHEQAVRWARRLGFDLEEPIAWGAERRPFHPFRVRKENVRV